CIALDEIVSRRIPNQTPSSVLDYDGAFTGQQATFGILEVLDLRQGQLLGNAGVHLTRGVARRRVTLRLRSFLFDLAATADSQRHQDACKRDMESHSLTPSRSHGVAEPAPTSNSGLQRRDRGRLE